MYQHQLQNESGDVSLDLIGWRVASPVSCLSCQFMYLWLLFIPFHVLVFVNHDDTPDMIDRLPKHKMRGNTVKFIQIHHYSKHPWFSINFNKLQLKKVQQCEPRQSICPRNAVLSECSAGLVVLSAILVLLSVRRGDGSKIAKPMGFHGLWREPASWKGDKPKGCDWNFGFHDIALHSEIQFPDGLVF